MRIILIAVFVGCSLVPGAAGQSAATVQWQKSAQSIIGALDYVAIDYPAAVQAGAVVNAAEFAEQGEFLTAIGELLLSLPPRPERDGLLEQAQKLTALVEARGAASEVAKKSRQLAAHLIRAYNVTTAPVEAPNPAAAAALYAELCAGCHGAAGHGDGPAGAALNPAPVDFHDVERARQRSLYGLYSTLTLGVQGTAMVSFSNLSDAQRWMLAFYVAGLRDDARVIARGERLWGQGAMRKVLPTLASFTSTTPAAIETGRPMATPVLAYLRHQPAALVASSGAPLQRTIDGLRDAVAAYIRKQPDIALQQALSAYLEGYELVEAPLRILDNDLAVGIERDMQILRNMIRDGASTQDVQSAVASLATRLQDAAALMSTRGSSTATMVMSAFLILLREGLEAILLLAAMSLYLRRTGNHRAMRYLHVGWIGALGAGALTWIGVKTVIAVSGVQREVIEGMAALLATAVLLYVGIWLHRRSGAAQWQAFLDQRLGRNLSAGTLGGIAVLSFIAVYREILETVLFYETLWLQSRAIMPLVAGASLATLALLAAGWVVLRVGARLPLRRFFQANGVLMFVLSLVFAGKGITALQEAGWVGVTFVGVPRIDWLGIYPTAQSVGLQLAIACLGGIWLVLLVRYKTATAAV